MNEYHIIKKTTLQEIAEAIRYHYSHTMIAGIKASDMAEMIRNIQPATSPGMLNTSNIEEWSYYCYQGVRAETLPYIDTSNGYYFSRMFYNANISQTGGDFTEIELHCENAITFDYVFYDCNVITLTLYFGEMRTSYMQQCFRNAGNLETVTIHGKIIIDNNYFNIAYSNLKPESVDSIVTAMEKDDIDAEHVVYFSSYNKNKILNSVKVNESNSYTDFGYESEEEWLAYKNIMNKISDKKINLG